MIKKYGYLSTGTLFGLCMVALTAGSTAHADRLPIERSSNGPDWAYQIATGSARAGEQFQIFELREGDCNAETGDCENDRQRSEVSLREKWKYGNDVWIGLSILVPSGFPISSHWTTVARIHQRGIIGLPSADGGISRPSLMQFNIANGRLAVAVWSLAGSQPEVTNVEIAEIAAIQDRWLDIQIHFDTLNADGRLEIYADGEKMLDLADTVTQIPDEYSFQYGLFRSGISDWDPPLPTQNLYFDEVRFGNSLEEVLVSTTDPMD